MRHPAHNRKADSIAHGRQPLTFSSYELKQNGLGLSRLRLLSRLLGGKPLLLESLHHLWVARPVDAALFRLIEGVRVQVGATLALALSFFYRDAVLIGKRIVTDAGHLPRDFHVRGVG